MPRENGSQPHYSGRANDMPNGYAQRAPLSHSRADASRPILVVSANSANAEQSHQQNSDYHRAYTNTQRQNYSYESGAAQGSQHTVQHQSDQQHQSAYFVQQHQYQQVPRRWADQNPQVNTAIQRVADAQRNAPVNQPAQHPPGQSQALSPAALQALNIAAPPTSPMSMLRNETQRDGAWNVIGWVRRNGER